MSPAVRRVMDLPLTFTAPFPPPALPAGALPAPPPGAPPSPASALPAPPAAPPPAAAFPAPPAAPPPPPASPAPLVASASLFAVLPSSGSTGASGGRSVVIVASLHETDLLQDLSVFVRDRDHAVVTQFSVRISSFIR